MNQDLNKLSGRQLNSTKLPLYFHERGGKCEFLANTIQFALAYSQSDEIYKMNIDHINRCLESYRFIGKTENGAAIITRDDTKAVYLYAIVDEERESDEDLEEEKFKVALTDWHDNRKHRIVKIADSINDFASRVLLEMHDAI